MSMDSTSTLKEREIALAPSLMTMDLDQFKEQLTFLDTRVNQYHIDIMDGHFVPNITLSPWFIEEARKISNLPMSAHLMVTDATFWVQQLVDIKCEEISMPVEVTNGVAFRLIDQIHDAGLKAGMVMNPETPVSSLMPFIDQLDSVMVMTIDPGFAGQRFLQVCLDKIVELRRLQEEHGYRYRIQMDGSTNLAHWKMISDADPDVYVIGRSGLFGLTDNIADSWKQMVQEYEMSTGYRFDTGMPDCRK